MSTQDSSVVTRVPQPFHWVNVFVGMLDSTFHLVEEEQFFSAAIITELLEGYRLEERPAPESLPAPLVLEMDAEYFSLAITKPRESHLTRPVREVQSGAPSVSVQAWAQTFVTMLTVAYPDLDPLELLQADKVFADILTSLGVPRRAAFHTPDDVLRAYHAIDVEY